MHMYISLHLKHYTLNAKPLQQAGEDSVTLFQQLDTVETRNPRSETWKQTGEDSVTGEDSLSQQRRTVGPRPCLSLSLSIYLSIYLSNPLRSTLNPYNLNPYIKRVRIQ